MLKFNMKYLTALWSYKMQKKDYKILLLDAPQTIWKWFDGTLPSPALAILASYVKNIYDTKVLDLNVSKTPWTALSNELKGSKADLIAIPCTHTCHVNEVKATIAMIRKLSPKSIICGGGIHFNVFYRDFLEKGLVDFVILGEGEITFPALVKALSGFKAAGRDGQNPEMKALLSELRAIDGLAFMSEGKLIKTNDRKYIENLDTVPLPSYELFPMQHYKIPIYGRSESFGITFGRGCVNRCNFCSESFGWNYTMRRNSPKYAVSHLKFLYDNFGKKTFIFADTDFMISHCWITEFLDELELSGIKIEFHIQTTCVSLLKNEDLIPRMKKNGLFEIMLGTESPFAEVLISLNKPVKNREIILKAMQTVKKHGVLLMAMMFWGTEYDSAQTLHDGLRFFAKYADVVCPNALTPYPGTPLYNEMKENGRIYETDMALYDQSHIIAPAGDMSYAETKATFDRELLYFFNLNPFFYMKLFSRNRFLRLNYWHYLKLVWGAALEGFKSPQRYKKDLYARREFEKAYGDCWDTLKD